MPGTRLFNGEDQFAWHARPWTAFQDPAQMARHHVVAPVYAIADWGLGQPLDAEEVVGSALLDAALERADSQLHPLVLPPLRLTPEQAGTMAFGIDIEIAHTMLRETITSAARTGAQRFILFNTCPYLEEWIDVAARDLRIDFDLQMFCLNLSGFGLDFHPDRSPDQSALERVLESLCGPLSSDSRDESQPFDPLGSLLGKATAVPFEEGLDGASILEQAALRIAAVLAEILAHAPLQEHRPTPQEGA